MKTPTTNATLPPQRQRFRLRFRTASLLWLAVVVAAFFVGRQSDDIAIRLSQVWSKLCPSTNSFQLVPQADGSLVFVSKLPLMRLQLNAPNVCTVNAKGNLNYQIIPIRDGKSQLLIWQSDGSGTQLAVVVKNGTVHCTSQIDIPVAQSSVAQNQAP